MEDNIKKMRIFTELAQEPILYAQLTEIANKIHAIEQKIQSTTDILISWGMELNTLQKEVRQCKYQSDTEKK